jgi:sarcosine oxidase subunit beta
MQSADVVIIGAGIVGSSIAYHLTELGVTDIVMLERESSTGKGSTGKSMGGVRAQFSTDVNIRMSMYSIPFYSTFDRVVGYECGYKPHGYLFCATCEEQMQALDANRVRQRAHGLTNAREVTRDEIQAMVPALRTDDIVGGSFCPTDGFVDPYSVMTGFTLKAQERGVKLMRSAEVTAIDVADGAVAGVRLSSGESIRSSVIVNAAGAWAAAVARMAGAALPVTPLRRMLVPTEPFEGIPEHCPMTIDMSNGFHFRREGLGLLLAWCDPAETAGFRTSFDPEFVEKILTRAVNRVPSFEALEVNPKRAWAGLYEVSPDHHAILGPAPEVEGLYYANGFSGHGVMHAPATGKVLADLIVKGGTDLIDAGVLSVTRFAEGREIHETAVL